jgi:hypothetical protein
MQVQNSLPIKPLDKIIIIPAIVLIVQSTPWMTVRLRLRTLVPLMLLYVVLSLIRRNRQFMTNTEHHVTVRLLVSYSLFSIAYLAADMLCLGELNNNYFVSQVFGLFYMWVFCSLFAARKVREIKVLTLITLGALLLASIMGASYLSGGGNRDVIRDMTGGGVNDYAVIDANLAGVGNFGSAYSIGLLAPALGYAFMRSRGLALRALLGVSALYFLLYAYRSGFSILMGAIFVGTAGYLGTLIFRNYTHYRLLPWICVILVLMITLFPTVGGRFSSSLSKVVFLTGNENYQLRVEAVVDAVEGSSTSYAVDRASRYWMSWGAFVENPILGWTRKSNTLMGGHSLILDFLAKGGVVLFCFLPIFVFAYNKYMKTMIYPSSRRSRILIEIYLVMVTMVCLLNPLTSPTVYASLFILLPGMSFFFNDSVFNRAMVLDARPEERRLRPVVT